MGLSAWFETFCGRLQVQDGGTISRRYKTLTRRLNTDFRNTDSETANSFYSGSYGRNTAINGFSDLDMVYELPAALYAQYDAYAGNGQSALLQAVKRSIENTYSRTNLRGDGQVVQVGPFTDGMIFEVVPAFYNKAGTYTFPDANDGGKWRTTDPKPEIAALRSRNNDCHGNLVRLCRMMRAWKNEWSVPIGGLLIDTLAYQFIENYTHRQMSYAYHDYMCRDFFDWMAVQPGDQTFWKAPGSGQYVWKRGSFQPKARRCHNLAVEAIGFEMGNPKREWSAQQRWREIFGTTFPD